MPPLRALDNLEAGTTSLNMERLRNVISQDTFANQLIIINEKSLYPPGQPAAVWAGLPERGPAHEAALRRAPLHALLPAARRHPGVYVDIVDITCR